MNLKEMFTIQNKIGNFDSMASMALADSRDVLLKKVTRTLKYQDAGFDKEDTPVPSHTDEVDYTAEQMLAFAKALVADKFTITSYINTTKAGLPMDLDATIQQNALLRPLLNRIKNALALKPSETFSNHTAHYLNQVSGTQEYASIPMVTKTELIFDRDKFVAEKKEIEKILKENSKAIDKAMVEEMDGDIVLNINYDVDFEDAFQEFLAKQ